MKQRSRGMVMLMALIMLTMLGLTTASALRGASVSVMDVVWIADEWRVRDAVQHALRIATRDFLLTSVPPQTAAHTHNGVRLAVTVEPVGHALAGSHWPEGFCHLLTVTGARGQLSVAMAAQVCLPDDPTAATPIVSLSEPSS